jgi:hypothetical protein
MNDVSASGFFSKKADQSLANQPYSSTWQSSRKSSISCELHALYRSILGETELPTMEDLRAEMP